MDDKKTLVNRGSGSRARSPSRSGRGSRPSRPTLWAADSTGTNQRLSRHDGTQISRRRLRAHTVLTTPATASTKRVLPRQKGGWRFAWLGGQFPRLARSLEGSQRCRREELGTDGVAD